MQKKRLKNKTTSKVATFIKRLGIFCICILVYLLLRILCEAILNFQFWGWICCPPFEVEDGVPEKIEYSMLLLSQFRFCAGNLCTLAYEYIPSIFLPCAVLTGLSYFLRRKSKWFMYSILIIFILAMIVSIYLRVPYAELWNCSGCDF